MPRACPVEIHGRCYTSPWHLWTQQWRLWTPTTRPCVAASVNLHGTSPWHPRSFHAVSALVEFGSPVHHKLSARLLESIAARCVRFDVATSLIYKSTSIYELAMLLLYGRHYASRYRAIADLISPGSSVLDLCCGPALLYQRYLRKKSVQYTGLDLNAKFIDRLNRQGGCGKVWDLRSEEPLPAADYVIMQASLYHFLPDPSAIVNRMLKAARKRCIIAEPIRNLATSKSRLLSLLGRLSTNPGSGEQHLRFDEASLADFFSGYSTQIAQSYTIAGEREKLYVLDARIAAV